MIAAYNNVPHLKEIIGYSEEYHSRSEVGCFYTDALLKQLNVDVSFQNTGGVRAGLLKGDITVRNIYEIEPFNNGVVVYEMSVQQIKEFLEGTGSGFYYAGIKLYKSGDEIIVRDRFDRIIPDEYMLKVGINDYIPAVHDLWFPKNGVVQPLTAAETMIAYLKNNSAPVNYKGCYRYFRF